MRLARTAILVFCGAVLTVSPLTAAAKLGAGQEGKLEVPGYKYPCVICLPDDYQPGVKLPLIFFLHGAGAKPSTWPWKAAIGGQGYIIVGLSYAPLPNGGGRGISGDRTACDKMIKFIHEVQQLVDKTYGIDRKRVFLTGLSMGGFGLNFYGFHRSAAGLYRGYAIIASGPTRNGPVVDFSVAKGLPVLVMNGEKDPNLRAANTGVPQLEKAGAIVTQVVLPGEGHVPSQQAMNGPMKKWLAGIARADNREQALAAVQWQPAELSGTAEKGAALEEFLKRQEFLKEIETPALIYCFSQQEKRGKLTTPAKKSAAFEQNVFSFPNGVGAPVASRYFGCFKIDVSEIRKRDNPLINQVLAPLVILLGKDGSVALATSKKPLKDAKLLQEMKALLTAEDQAAVDARIEKITPLLGDMKKLAKKVKAARKSLAKLRKKGKRKKIEKKTALLAKLEKQYDKIRDQLLE